MAKSGSNRLARFGGVPDLSIVRHIAYSPNLMKILVLWLPLFVGALAGGVRMLFSAPAHAAEPGEGYDRLSREAVIAALDRATRTHPAEFYAKDLTGTDLSGLDFKRANLTASVFNRANLTNANLSGCNLTVAFAEEANFSGADLRGAIMFSMQLRGAKFGGADLSGARFIGDMTGASLEGAKLTKLDGAADMKNQSMGLMRASFVSANLRHADFSGAAISRANFSFADLTGARFVGATMFGVEFAGTNASAADFSGADLRQSTFIDSNFAGARLDGADFTGSKWRGVRGVDEREARKAKGFPGPNTEGQISDFRGAD